MIKTKSFIPFVVAILLFLRLGPYFVWKYEGFYFSYGLTVLISLLFFLNIRNLGKRDKNLLLVYSAGAIAYGFANHNVLVGLFTIFLGIVAFAKDDFNKKVFDSFSTLYCILISFGVLSWILILLGVLSPIGTVETVSEDAAKQSGYIVYPFAIMIANSDAVRFRSMFDEPGVVGAFSVILLCINKFNFKDWRTYSLLLSGILSLSFYFFIVLFIYASFSLLFIKKKPGYLLFLSVGVLLAFLLTKNNNALYEVLWQRFEWDAETGTFVGDNRMAAESNIELYYQSVRGSSQYWFGAESKRQVLNIIGESSSYKNAVLLYGMFFFILYCSFFVLYGYTFINNKKYFLLFCFVFLGMEYQRAGIYEPIMLFLFTYYARYLDVSVNRNVLNSSVTI